MSNAQDAYIVIAGFGLPGRCLTERLCKAGIDYMVIELNAQTVARTSTCGIKIMAGDASDEQTLRAARVERATIVALMVPNDEVVLKAVSHVRRLNPTAKIIARCAFTSTGLEATRRGANVTIVAEQVVARELETVLRDWIR